MTELQRYAQSVNRDKNLIIHFLRSSSVVWPSDTKGAHFINMDIFITHLIIIINSEVSSFSHCCHIFRGCVCLWDGCTILFCHLLHIYIHIYIYIYLYICMEHWDTVSIIDVQSMVFANDRMHWSYSFVCRLHHLIIIIMQTYLKALNY